MKVIKLIITLQFFALTVYAQISGNSTVQVYTVEQYTLNQGTIYSNPRWSAIGGVIQSDTRNVTTYTITVKWDVQGTGKVNFLNENVVIASKDITITGCNLAPPDPIATLSSTNPTCGDKLLSYTGTPPANVKWYWQTSSSGTDESSSGGYSASVSGTYYLRAKAVCGPLWSGGSLAITVSVNPNPSVPNAPIVSSNTCGNKTLTMNSPPSGNIAWYWQGVAPSGTSTANSDLNYIVTTAGTANYYLRAKNSSSGCWSTSSAGASVTVIEPGPPYCSSSYLNSTTSYLLDTWTKTYSDGFGNLLQSQEVDNLTGRVLGVQPIKDSYGNVAGSTLPAPIQNDDFAYRYNFVSNPNGVPYGASDFDRPINNNSAGEINNPNAVGNGGPNTLGWYYSSSNTLEPLTPVTQFPYSRAFTQEGPNPTSTKVSGPGDQYRMGAGHDETIEKQKFTKLELVHYYNLKPFFVEQNVYEDNLIVNADANSTTGYSKNQNVTISGFSNNGQTYVKCYSNQTGNTSGIWPIEGAISVTPSTSYILKVRGYSSGASAKLYVRTGTSGSNILWPGATIPSGAASEGWVQSTFTVPAGVTSISVGVLFGSSTIGSEININSIMLTAGTNNSIPGYKEITTNSDGKKFASFYDVNGNLLATANYNGSALENWSYNYYNDLGQLIASVAPNGVNTLSNNYPNFVTKYKYDHLGRLIETTSPDAGISKFVYSTDGKIRFSQTEQQRIDNKFSYTNYDKNGRAVESGEYTSTDAAAYTFETHDLATTPSANSILNIIDNYIPIGYTIESITSSTYIGISKTLDQLRCSDHTFVVYDFQTADLPLNDDLHATQTYVAGRISKTKNSNSTTWYSYTENGYLEWTKQQINGLAGFHTIDYSYDYLGSLTRMAYNEDAPGQFYHFYQYNGYESRLVRAYTSTDSTTRKLAARYYYYTHGPLKRVELGTNLQGIDYVYNIDGTLKLINHSDPNLDPGLDGISGTNAAFMKDIFGETIDYNTNDYTGAGYNEGNAAISGTYPDQFGDAVKAIRWHNHVDGHVPRVYAFTYDSQYQMDNADFGNVSGTNGTYSTTISGSQAYKEDIGGYDKNGNIASLVRKGKTGNTIANYSYTYQTNTNKLASVSNNGSAFLTYQYNANGQMIQQIEGSRVLNIKYNAYGLTSEVKQGDNRLVTYEYDDRGDIAIKTVYDPNVADKIVKRIYYVNDAEGNLISVYEQTTFPTGTATQTEIPIYGLGRIGIYRPTVDVTLYEVADHLGNVRGVIGNPSPLQYKATLEDNGQVNINNPRVQELVYFKNLSTTAVDDANMNHSLSTTSVPVPKASAYLKWISGMVGQDAAQKSVGPAISLKVEPGDKIDIQTWAKYKKKASYSRSGITAAMASILGSSYVGTASGLDVLSNATQTFQNGLTVATGAAGGNGNDVNSVPYAYVYYMLYDRSFNFITAGWKRVTTQAGFDEGSQALSTHEQVVIPSVTITEPGYIYIFVSNESENTDVWFDDLQVDHQRSSIVAGADYYPFGLPMENREITREEYRFGYQGQFSEEEKETGWNSFELRMYDARIGRWVTVDPYGQFASPYLAMGNMPAMNTDSNGGICCPDFAFQFATGKLLGMWAYGTVLPAVTVTHSLLSASIVSGVSTALARNMAFMTGAANALNNNITMGFVPLVDANTQAHSFDYANGQYAGQWASIVWGAAETMMGFSITEMGGGMILTGVAAPVGLAVAGLGIGVGTHGIGVANHAMGNLNRMHWNAAGKTSATIRRHTKFIKHHIASNKHKTKYTKLFENIAKKYKLKLDDTWNIVDISDEFHYSNHPDEYHEFVYRGMVRADMRAKGDQQKFLKFFDEFVKQPLLDNPSMLNRGN